MSAIQPHQWLFMGIIAHEVHDLNENLAINLFILSVNLWKLIQFSLFIYIAPSKQMSWYSLIQANSL